MSQQDQHGLIIVVEDEDDHFFVLCSQLKRTVFAEVPVRRCSSFAEFVDLCSEHGLADESPIILCDQTLQDSTPQQTTRAVLEIAPANAVVLVVTSLDYNTFGDEVLRAGAQDYLIKDDLNHRRLERSIKSAIHRKGLLEQIARAYDEMDQFARLVAHDLKTPLATAMMEIDFSPRVLEAESPEVRDTVRSLREELKSAMGIIDRMLGYARASGKPSDLEAVGVQCIAEKAVHDAKVTIEERGAHVTVDAACNVLADPGALRQVLLNLITNAIVHNAGDAPTVLVTSERSDSMVAIRITDNGRGISEDAQSRIFDIGFRSSTASDGSGLGLAIARRLVRMQNGTLEIRSSDSSGTVFEIMLGSA